MIKSHACQVTTQVPTFVKVDGYGKSKGKYVNAKDIISLNKEDGGWKAKVKEEGADCGWEGSKTVYNTYSIDKGVVNELNLIA